MNRIRILRHAIAGVLVAAAIATTAHAQSTRPVIDLATAKAMVAGCETLAAEKNWRMSIAVVDDGSNLKHFARMDGAVLVGVDLARSKAATSARFPVPSRQWGEFSKTVRGLDLVPGMVSFAGGLPVRAGGQHIGGIGVSGGTPDEDEQCAQAALDAVRAILK